MTRPSSYRPTRRRSRCDDSRLIIAPRTIQTVSSKLRATLLGLERRTVGMNELTALQSCARLRRCQVSSRQV
ncbi:unnamed protein product, partial [Iphiclides podalirius]